MIDCHAHLAYRSFDEDRTEVIERACNAGIEKIVVVGEDYAEDLKVLEVCQQHPQVLLPCIGLHPDRFSEERPLPTGEQIEAIRALARDHRARIVGIGEVGLDYWTVKSTQRRASQRACLESMIALAKELDLPLNVHSRSAGHYVLDLLASSEAERVLLHAYDGKAGHARDASRLHDWVFSIPPSVVRSKQKQKLARLLPLESLALESDSPALGPERGVRNEPINLAVTVKCIADLKNVTEETVRQATTENARRLFRL